VSKTAEEYVYFFGDLMHMLVQGFCGLACNGKEELGLILMKEEVLGLITAGSE
jgi:hypothetical protein